VTLGWFNSTERYGRRCWTNIFSPKFLHVPLGVGAWLWPLGYEERRCWANCSRNSFPRFSTCGHDPPTSQTDRQRDGQTDDMRSQDRVLHIVYRAVKIKASLLHLQVYEAQNFSNTRRPFHTWYRIPGPLSWKLLILNVIQACDGRKEGQTAYGCVALSAIMTVDNLTSNSRSVADVRRKTQFETGNKRNSTAMVDVHGDKAYKLSSEFW